MATDLNSLIGGVRVFPILPSAARTATPNAQEFDGAGRTDAGLIVVIDMTAVTATGTVTVLIEGVDRVSGKTWTVLQSTAVATVSTTVLRIHSQLTAAANLVAKDALPPIFRVTCTHVNAVSMTYSVSGHLTY